MTRLPISTALVALLPVTVSGTDVSTKVVDRLGRPVPGVVMEVYWHNVISKEDVRKVELVRLVSDLKGRVRGTFDEQALPRGQEVWVKLTKDGYSGFSTTGLRPQFIRERSRRLRLYLSRLGNLDGV